MTKRIDIGIDGGGTGCRVALCADGVGVIEARGGPANIVTDPAGAEAAIRTTLVDALHQAGLGETDLSAARICAGLAGGRLPGMADAFAMRLPFLAYVTDDSVTALEGALEGADGTLASLGTGSFFIRKSEGRIRHIGGWGLQLGDEGSAAWLGRRALAAALHVSDGRAPADPLADALLAAAAPHPVLVARDARPADYVPFAKLVLDHAQTRLGKALIAETMAALQDGLRDVGHQMHEPLVITGGLGELLTPFLPAVLGAACQPARGRALDGALRLARGLP